MHGIIFKAFSDFVTDTYGDETWNEINDAADTDTSLYLPVKSYPDEELLQLLSEAVEISEASESELLYEFGNYAAPNLADTFRTQIDYDWDEFDLLANTEEAIHAALRDRDYEPPELTCERMSSNEVRIEYGAENQLCDFAEGLIDGILDLYESEAVVTEQSCQHEDDPLCEFVIGR